MLTQRGISLASSLTYEPQELRFGTSGRRGNVSDLTQLEIYINVSAELGYLLSLPVEDGGVRRGDEIYLAHDLRKSSTEFDQDNGGRGQLWQAAALACEHAGMRPVNLGPVPTPALTYYALLQGKSSIMITGSHIPFDRNGYKLNTSRGELMKEHEQPINAAVAQLREQVYSQDAETSLFDSRGMLKAPVRAMTAADAAGEEAYVDRYAGYFGKQALAGLRILFYEHSCVGRELFPRILRELGATVYTAGRSERFVPIDTENVHPDLMTGLQQLADEKRQEHGPLDAVVSTDGDSDRPLLFGVAPDGTPRFFGGDLLGMVVAEFLAADAVVVPITCNDAIDRGPLAKVLQPKTKIGSPYVLAGIEEARRQGRRRVCGWEANGGFLAGSDLQQDGRTLRSLPTRDAALPLVCALQSAKQQGKTVVERFDRLPKRFSRAALVPEFPKAKALAILRMLTPAQLPASQEIVFGGRDAQEREELQRIREQVQSYFPDKNGFGAAQRVNYLDGVRIWFAQGDVVHLRPSGNADEMRIYAVSDTQERADSIARSGVEQPDGVIFAMAAAAAAGWL